MQGIKRYILSVLLLIATILLCHAGGSVRFYGYVVDADNVGIDMANVFVKGTTIGTTTNRNGYYSLSINSRDSLVLVFSMLGYRTLELHVLPTLDVININASLLSDTEQLSEVEVRGIRKQQSMMDQTDAQSLRLMPDATGGSIESMLITFAGVRQNNELSSQYNVRGGNFDENSVYVNGIEVHRPLLLRSGQQEGLSFVNADMVESLEFSAGGFDAAYGDRMSSVLDIRYKRPTATEARLSAGVLGASAYVGAGNNNYSTMHGIRYKTSRYMLGALPTKGNYDPNYIDYQTFTTWRLGPRPTDATSDQRRWTMSLLANFSQNSYIFRPDTLTTSFGTQDMPMQMSADFNGQEKDLFRTLTAALAIDEQITPQVNIGFSLSGFYTSEQENYDITSYYRLMPKQLISDDSPETEMNRDDNILPGATEEVLATGYYHEHARNRLHAGIVTLAHHGDWKRENNTLRWELSAQAELINDDIHEWEWRDSSGYSLPNQPHQLQLYNTIIGQSQLYSARVQGYAQDTYKWLLRSGKLLLTGGLRFNYWTVNNEFLLSPRASVVYLPQWQQDFSFRLATGLYYQAPFYKELRRVIIDPTGVGYISPNYDLKAARSVHVVAGMDYYFRAWGRPFKLSAEAYYKYMDRMVSYTVDNVRVRYSGENDAVAYSTGADLKLYGELVPGAESWISVSAMRSRENLLNDQQGWIPAPQEQRYAFSMFFQDYLPRLPQLKVHLKTIFSDGLPYGNPRLPSTRAAFRTSPYWRVDIGASLQFSRKTDRWMAQSKAVDRWSITFEVFNLAGQRNVNSHFWVTDAYNRVWAFPNKLTGRMFNLRVAVDLKEK